MPLADRLPTAESDLRVVAARLPLEDQRVLVVDDDELAREALRAVLTAEGAEVTTADSAAEALRALDLALPNVMLVDLAMPVVDGFTFVEQIRMRSSEPVGRLPIAALTGYLSAEDRARAYRAGVQAYLLKPVDAGELIETIKTLASGRTCEPA